MEKFHLFSRVLFIFSFFCGSYIKPYIVSCSHWNFSDSNNNNSSKIVPFGDYHIMNDIDSEQWVFLENLIHQLSADTKPTLFIIEEFANNEYLKSPEDIAKLNVDIGLLARLRQLAREHDWKHGSVTFKAGDYRDKIFYNTICSFFYSAKRVSNTLNAHFISDQEMYDYGILVKDSFFEPTILTAIDNWLHDNPNAWNTFDEFKSTLLSKFDEQTKKITIADFSHHFLFTAQEAHKVLAKYKSLQKYDQKLTNYVNKTQQMLKQYPADMSILELLISQYKDHKSFKKAHDEVWNTFMVPYVLIADVGLLSQILQGLPSYQRIITYFGETHTHNINKMLELLNHSRELSFKLLSKEKYAQHNEHTPVTQQELGRIVTASEHQTHKDQINEKTVKIHR